MAAFGLEFLGCLVLHHKRHVHPIQQAKWRRQARKALCMVEDAALMVMIIRLARLTHVYVLSFFFSVQVAQVITHISPLVFSSVTVLFQPSPALRIEIGVIFVIGVNELLFLARNVACLEFLSDVRVKRRQYVMAAAGTVRTIRR